MAFSLKRRLQGKAVVLPAVLVVQLIALSRNLIVARLLGPEQFGIAAIFILVSQFLDLTTDTGLNKFLLSNRFRQRSAVQASVHFVALIRGCVIACIVVVAAFPVLKLMRVNPDMGAVLLLAALPIAIGALHYDNARLQGQGVFWNDALTQLAGEALGTLVAVGAALWYQSYIAVIAGLVARAFGQAIVSHATAERKYQVRLSPLVRSDLVKFSGPLMVNGFILFLSMQSDRALVASFFTPAVLGVYSAAFQLVNSGTMVLTRTFGAIHLPGLAAAQQNPSLFLARYKRIAIAVVLAYFALTAGVTAVGADVIPAIYGSRFTIDPVMIVLIGAVQGIRMVRVWPSTIALSINRTSLVLGGNILRICALPIATLMIVLGFGIVGLLCGYVIGELIALVVAVELLPGQATYRKFSRHALVSVILATGISITATAIEQQHKWMTIFITPIFLAIAAVATFLFFRLQRGYPE